MPTPSRSADVYQRRELLGGKGANQAVGLAQLGMRPALAGVVGEDQVGQRLLTQAGQDRVDVSAVARRPGVRTALIVAAAASLTGCGVAAFPVRTTSAAVNPAHIETTAMRRIQLGRTRSMWMIIARAAAPAWSAPASAPRVCTRAAPNA